MSVLQALSLRRSDEMARLDLSIVNELPERGLTPGVGSLCVMHSHPPGRIASCR